MAERLCARDPAADFQVFCGYFAAVTGGPVYAADADQVRAVFATWAAAGYPPPP